MSVNGRKLASELEERNVKEYLECVRQHYYYNEVGIVEALNMLEIEHIFKYFGVRAYQVNVHMHSSFTLEHVTRIIIQYQSLKSAKSGLDAHYCNELSVYILNTLSKCAIITSAYLEANPDYIPLFNPVNLLIHSSDMSADFIFKHHVLCSVDTTIPRKSSPSRVGLELSVNGSSIHKQCVLEYLARYGPFSIIRANPEIDWSWYDVSKNDLISAEDVINNPDLPWAIGLFRRPLLEELLERLDCNELLTKYCGNDIRTLTNTVPLWYIASNYNKLSWPVSIIKNKLAKFSVSCNIWDYLPLLETYPELLAVFPNKETQNPPMAFVSRTQAYWSMNVLSRYVQPTDFLENLDLAWNYEELLCNKYMQSSVIVEYIADHVSYSSRNWYTITDKIDIDYIISRPKNYWDWGNCLDRLTHEQIWSLIKYMKTPGIYKKLSMYYPPVKILVEYIQCGWDWPHIISKMDIPEILLQKVLSLDFKKISYARIEISKSRIKSMYILDKTQAMLVNNVELAPELIDMIIGYAVYL